MQRLRQKSGWLRTFKIRKKGIRKEWMTEKGEKREKERREINTLGIGEE